MGSLLPGWSESQPGVAPKEFQDYDDKEEEQGYFALYNRLKRQSKEEGDMQGDLRALQRRLSMPVGRRSSLSGKAGSFGAKEAPAAFSSPGQASLDTVPTPTHRQLLRRNSMPEKVPGDHYVLSKGDQGLEVSPSLPGTHPNLDAYKIHKDGQRAELRWWRNFDSAHLNKEPDVQPGKEHGGYIPQYVTVGQQLHYRGTTEGVPAPIHAV